MRLRVSSVLGVVAIMVLVLLVPVLGAVGGASGGLRVEQLRLDRPVAAPPAADLAEHDHALDDIVVDPEAAAPGAAEPEAGESGDDPVASARVAPPSGLPSAASTVEPMAPSDTPPTNVAPSDVPQPDGSPPGLPPTDASPSTDPANDLPSPSPTTSIDADAGGSDAAWFTTGDIPARGGVMVGADWGGEDLDIAVRARQDGDWTEWFPLEVSLDQPDGEEARSANPDASSPVWFGPSEAFQVRASEPVDVDLSVVEETGPVVEPTATAEAATTIRSRAAWKADESLRDGRVNYASKLAFGVVHHEGGVPRWSAGDIANGCPQAPAAIRAIHRYHTQALGWWDIGYNFVVDPCGRIWEGRAGGTGRNVIGSHAAGFNTGSFGVLALGTFEGASADPVTQRLTRGLAEIFAHKFTIAGIDATTSVTHVGGCNGCSSRYGPGTRVRLPRVLAHQRTSRTSCPGSRLLGALFTGAGSSAKPRPWFLADILARTRFEPTVTTKRWAGSNRIGTAVELSRRSFARADAVVVATASAYADGLVAGPLAATRGAPVLLATSRRLPSSVAAEIRRLGARRAYVVGGRAAVSGNVVAGLRRAGATRVWRLGGANRYATAEKVADDIRRRTRGRTALLALGDHPVPNRAYPDALTAGAHGAVTRTPVLLVGPNRLPQPTRRALQGGNGTWDVNRVVTFGGTSAVTDAVVVRAGRAVPGQVSTRRFAGRNRYHTATLAMDALVDGGLVTRKRVLVVSGADWPDALGAAAAARKLRRPMLLVPPSRGYRGSVVEDTVARWDAFGAVVIGGRAAVSSRVFQEIRTTR